MAAWWLDRFLPFQKGQPSLYSDPGKIWNVICIYLNQLLPLKETSMTSVLQNQGFWRCCQCHLTKLPGAVTLVHLKTIMPLLCVLQGVHLHYAISLPGSSSLWRESVPVPAPTFQEGKGRTLSVVRGVRDLNIRPKDWNLVWTWQVKREWPALQYPHLPSHCD